MKKKAELANPTSCLNKAGDEEPIFVLRAKDLLAPMAVRHWCMLAVDYHEADKIAEARELAAQMERWRNDNVPTPQPPPPIDE